MSAVALFLDVDKTLTDDNIQENFATALGCLREYVALEDAFQDQRLGEQEFGDRLVSLFSSHSFTDSLAAIEFPRIRRRSGADEVLRLPLDKFLVSSGPNYYVRRLADTFDIAQQNVLCSTYGFDGPSGVISSCRAISDEERTRFVSERAPEFVISIGVGDNIKRDSGFIDACSLGMLTVPSATHLSLPNLWSLATAVQRLMESVSHNALGTRALPGRRDPHDPG